MANSNQNVGPFDQADVDRTLALEVDGNKFYVSREILANYSPVFKAMQYGEFAEAKKDSIELRDKKSEDIQELLLCLIPSPEIKLVDDQNVDLMLGFADEYQIQDLRSRCVTFLIEKFNKSGNGNELILEILHLASKHRLRPLLDSCVKRCAVEFGHQQLQGSFDGLRSEVVAALVLSKKPVLGTKCELQIKVGACHYGLYHNEKHYVAKCANCDFEKCVSCSKELNAGPCKVHASDFEVENTVRALLDRV